MNPKRHTSPDPVGIAVLLLIAVLALFFLCTAFTSEGAMNTAMDIGALVMALVWLWLVRLFFRGLRRWRHIHDNWKPPHHEDPYR